jgi:hypothetical protein
MNCLALSKQIPLTAYGHLKLSNKSLTTNLFLDRIDDLSSSEEVVFPLEFPKAIAP